ncbi:hypothetical protein FHR34_000571 [Kitasatospora kifunensis]|uniref:Uncharacterized protein n=1 Tax=Kitasatospora kifunensis TaxID=58351 RepID=A0A7W7QXZ8_KITKI|nr:hypothetical protein [Kitasatospora kifunensis]
MAVNATANANALDDEDAALGHLRKLARFFARTQCQGRSPNPGPAAGPWPNWPRRPAIARWRGCSPKPRGCWRGPC